MARIPGKKAVKAYQRTERRLRDEAAGSYDEWYLATRGQLFDRRELALFAAALAPTRSAGRALDVGSGTGRISELATRMRPRVIAADFSLESLQVLHRRLPHVLCVAADVARAIPCPTASMDVVAACQVFQHLRPEDHERALSEAHRVLVPGGRLLVAGANASYWRYRGVREFVFENGLYVRRSDRRDMSRVARKAGFHLVEVRHYRALPLQRLKSHLWSAVDRLATSVPAIGKRLAAFVFFVLEKDG